MGSRANSTRSSRAARRSASYTDAPSLRASPAGCTTAVTECRLRLRRRRGAAMAVRLPAFLRRGLLGRRRAARQLPAFLRRELLVFLPLLLDFLPLLRRQLFYRFVLLTSLASLIGSKADPRA